MINYYEIIAGYNYYKNLMPNANDNIIKNKIIEDIMQKYGLYDYNLIYNIVNEALIF